MASPPFDIAQTVPGDSDIVSQYPTAERSFRDIVESWLLIDHNTDGRHAQVALARQGTMPTAAGCSFAAGTDPAGVASNTLLYSKSDGGLYIRSSEQGVVPIGNVPVGSVVAYAGAAEPAGGWKFCNSQVLACASFPALFGVIGATYNTGGEGAGNFRVPDLRGRAVFGWELMGSAAGRITNPPNNFTAQTLGASGGVQSFSVTLVAGNIPTLTAAETQTGGRTAQHAHTSGVHNFAALPTQVGTGGDNQTIWVQSGSALTFSVDSPDHAHFMTVTVGTASPSAIERGTVPPALVMSWIIKT